MEEQQKTYEYHAVILHANGDFATESFLSDVLLAERLRELVNKDVSVSCFKGERLRISKPPYRYLLAPGGNIALYDLPEKPEPDDTGYLGVDPVHLEGPPQIKTPTIDPQQPDEFFSDNAHEIRNIFDDALPDPDA